MTVGCGKVNTFLDRFERTSAVMTMLLNSVLGIAMVLAVSMIAIFVGDVRAARRVLVGADSSVSVAAMSRKVSLNYGAVAGAAIFAIGVIVSFLIIN